MDRQLKREYLDGRERRHGIFLVGWFGPEHAKPKSMTFGGLADSLHRRALELCDDEHTIRALAIDLTIGKNQEPGTHWIIRGAGVEAYSRRHARWSGQRILGSDRRSGGGDACAQSSD
jgi:hypothetical protein